MQPALSSPNRAERERDLPTASAVIEANRCWATVSFVLEDACWCEWLYREFDGVRVPRALHGKPSRDGLPYPERLSVSPDPRDPLQLENHIGILQSAQHLIIVVSPGSARADVIQEHMRLFKARGGEERIIALVVKGHPASPAAEPGSESDREWLPKWLGWRFENNAFAPADRDEPMVVDARLGVSSLAEVRAYLFASMLGVRVAQLAELGVVVSSSPSERVLNDTRQNAPVPQPTPTPMPRLAVAPPEPALQHSRWPVALCGIAALAALGCLVFWPASDSRSLPLPAPVAQSNVPEPVVLAVEQKPVVVVAPVTPPEPASVEVVPQSAPPEATVASPVDIAAEDPAITRKRFELTAKRDRLIRLAEMKASAGDHSEALEVFELATESAKEIVRLDGKDHDSVLELALLYRRLGTLAANVNSSAEARGHFESGRKTLQALRAGGHLPKEGAKVLADLESAMRRLPKD